MVTLRNAPCACSVDHSMLGGAVGSVPVGPVRDVVAAVRGWAFDLHLLGFSIPPHRLAAAESAAVAAASVGAPLEDCLEFARVALDADVSVTLEQRIQLGK